MREAHEEAVQKALATFNSIAVGTGSARQKYEKRLHTFLRKAFEVIILYCFLKIVNFFVFSRLCSHLILFY